MLKYFRHNSVFFDFRTTRRVVGVREVADRDVVNVAIWVRMTLSAK